MTVPATPDIAAVHPLSPAQAGMLFHRLKDESGSYYLDQDRYRLTGPLDADVFRAAWQTACDRHDALRTAVVWEGQEQPLAVVRTRITVPWEEVDLSGLPEDEQRRRISELVETRRGAGLNLATEPPLALVLVRLADDVHDLLWTSQHIVRDGWSASLILREVFALYRAGREGRTASLPDPVPHARYISWLRSRDDSGQERFWRDRLSGFEAPTGLRLPLPARIASENRAIRVPISLSRDFTARLHDLTRRQRITLTTVVEAAWALTLSVFSGERDVVFGAVRSGRMSDVPEAEAVVGMMVNTVPVRTTIAPASPARAWLSELHRRSNEQRAYEHASLANIQSWSSVPHPMPLFESLVTVQALPSLDAAEMPDGLCCELVEALGDTGYGASLVVTPGDVFTGELVCRTENVDAETATALVSTFTRLLHGIVAHPDALVGTLDLVGESDREQPARAFTPGRGEPSGDRTPLLDLIARHARSHPDEPAVLWGESGRLDYGHLSTLADAWATELAAHGVGPETAVGICFDRSPEHVVAMLAVLRAGGHYVPIATEHPQRLQADVLSDAGAKLLLTSKELALRLEESSACSVLSITLELPTAGQADRPPRTAHPDALAYIVYTSGPTDAPRGVSVPHRALDWFAATADYAGIGRGDVVGLASSPSFETLNHEVWTALACGAALRMIPGDLNSEPVTLAERLSAWGVDAMFVTAAQVEELSRHAPAFAANLRVLRFGGQAADPLTVAKVAAASAPCGLFQEYGLTETAGCSLVHRVDSAESDFLPLGRPIGRTTEYLLDADLRPVLPGVPGELYIGGDGLARGYHGRAALTAERFVPDPFTQGRMYRTGDLARLRTDGRLEFLRRAGEQVEIRGVRVVPSEIATVLRQHPDVDAATVVVRQDARHGAVLVGYVVPAVDARTDVSDLQGFAASRLPAYMLPTTYVLLDALPLSVTGKVDLERLPEPEAHSTRQGTSGGPSASAMENSIAELWARILGLAEVGIDENFFRLGGDSLVAVRVIGALARELRLSAKVRDLFDAPTVRQFASVTRPIEADSGPRIPAAPDSLVPLSSEQRRMWMLRQVSSGGADYNSSTLLRLRGHLNIKALEAALTDIVAKHVALRVRITMGEDGPVQQVGPVPDVRVQRQDLTDLPVGEREDAARLILMADAEREFDLEGALFMRGMCVRLADEEHLLLLAMHHIAYDAASERIIACDLADRYAKHQAAIADPVRLPKVSYVDYAAWEHGRRSAGHHKGDLAYWENALRDLPLAELPTDRTRPPTRSGAGGVHDFTVSPAQADALGALGTEHGASTFMAFLAVFGVLIGRHCGQTKVAVGTAVDLRDQPDLADMVGFMVNTLVLCIDLDGDPTFVELLRRVRAGMLDAHAHRHMPFDAVVEAVNPDRGSERTPLFDVFFQLFPEAAADWSLPGIEVTPVPMSRRTSHFDLDIEMVAGTDGAMLGRILYNSELFEPATIRVLADRFVALIERICVLPNTPIGALDLLVDEDHTALSVLADNSQSEGTRACQRLDEMVAGHAQRTPHAPAVVHAGATLDYADLDRLSDRLAASLYERGVTRGDTVGLWAERRPETLVGILAVLRAGAAYIPLEPTDPAERVARLLHDRGCAAVLIPEQIDRVPEEFRALAVDLRTIDSIDAGLPRVDTSPSDLAYIIHTSGSTGLPKAVGVEHASVTHYARVAAEAYRLTSRDRVLQMSSLGFDAFVSELWTTLAAGASLVLPEDSRMSPDEFFSYVAASGTTVVDLPTAYWHLLCAWLADAPHTVIPESLRLVIIGGEAANAAYLEQWRAAVPSGVRLINSYGPTETTCVVTHADLSAGQPDEARDRAVAIGLPLPGTRAYVLDSDLRPVPPGATGTLFIAGPQVARGYLGDPRETATAFLPDPWGPSGTRMYRTGDAVRLARTGQLQMLGRTDNQVKVRGYRVELDEVESALAAYPGARSAAAVVHQHPRSGPMLVAYVVPASVGRLDSADVRAFLQDRLPRHAVPDVVVVLDRLPLTSTGKVDRRALPVPGGGPDQHADTTQTPLTEAQQALARIWLSVLPVGQVTPGDRFFDLGGHSLALARVGARIRKDFQLDLPLSALYERPTLAEQAIFVESLVEAEIAGMSDAEIRHALADPATGVDSPAS